MKMEQVHMEGKAAFEMLYHANKGPVYTVALRLLQNRAAAEDVTQEVFLRLYTSPPTDELRKPKAWLLRVTHNLAVDALRKRREEAIDDAVPSGEPSVEERAGLRLDLEAALAALGAEAREIVTLHLNADLTFGEIAGVTGFSLPSVYRRYQKAIHTLREILKGDTI